MDRLVVLVYVMYVLLVCLTLAYIIIPSTIKEESNTAVTLRLNVDTLVKSINDGISTETLDSAHSAGWFTDAEFIDVVIGINVEYYIGIFYTKTYASETTRVDMQDRFAKLLTWSGNISGSKKTQIQTALMTAKTSLLQMKTDWINEITLQNTHETIVRDCGEYVDSAIMSVVMYVASFAHEIERYANQSSVISPNLDWSHLIIDTDSPGDCSSYCYAEKTFASFTVVVCILLLLMLTPGFVNVMWNDGLDYGLYEYKILGITTAFALLCCLIQIVTTAFTKEDCTPFREISKVFDISILQQKHSASTETTATYDSGAFLAWTVLGILAMLWCYALIMYRNIKQSGYSQVEDMNTKSTLIIPTRSTIGSVAEKNSPSITESINDFL